MPFSGPMAVAQIEIMARIGPLEIAVQIEQREAVELREGFQLTIGFFQIMGVI